MRRAVSLVVVSAVTLVMPVLAAFPAVADSPPVVTSVPAAEPSAGAEGVVHGEGLSGATAVRVGGLLATIKSDSDTQLKIVFPAHDPGSVHVRVTTPEGTSPATDLDLTYYTAAATQTWTQTGSFDTVRGKMIDISCPTDTFCAAIDDSRVVTYDGTGWSAPHGLTSADNLAAISCASSSFCMVADSAGQVRTYDGTTWSRPRLVDSYGHPIADISCPLTTWCVALDTHGIAFAYDGSSWDAPVPTGVTTGVTVSCAAANACLAGGAKTASWDGSSWTVDTAAPSGSILDIDCFSTTTCAVATTYFGGHVWLRQSGTWTVTPDSPTVTAVACLSATACTAVGGQIYSWDGSSWTDVAGNDAHLPYQAVTCGASLCFVVDQVGRARSGSAATWNQPETVIVPRGKTTSVACPTTTLCFAADEIGTVKTWNGTSWSDPVVIDPDYRGAILDCPTATFCMAVGQQHWQTWNGTGWSDPAPFALYSVNTLSCASPSFCLAVESGNPKDTERWTGSEWVADATVPRGSGYRKPLEVSCPNASFCLSDLGLEWTPTGWQPIDGPTGLTVGCGAGAFCVAAGRRQVVPWQHGSFGTPRVLPSIGNSLVSCVSKSFCEVVTGSHAVVWNGKYWTDEVSIPGSDGWLESLACPAADQCVGVTADATYQSSPA